MITVGLPTWGNKDNIWMPLEGLSRQDTSQDWELIVSECNSFDKPILDQIKEYWPKLQKAGCKRVLYKFNPVRLSLGQKWKEMAKRATGDIFLLQASDDFPIRERISITARKIDGAEWFDFGNFLIYDICSAKMIMFDKTLVDKWKTGGSKAVKTYILKNLPDNEQRRGVDHFIHDHVSGEIKEDWGIHLTGINTNGVNVISKRGPHFKNPKPPYKSTNYTLDDIQIPRKLKDRIKNTKPVSLLDRMRHQRIKIRFKKAYRHFREGHKMYVTGAAYFNLIDYVDLIDKSLPEPFEEELT
jgi:hypothetical protein